MPAKDPRALRTPVSRTHQSWKFNFEKSTHTLHLFENQNGFPKLIKTFQIATGKIKGNKYNEGDHKTPEGIYQLGEFLSKEQLHSMYQAKDAKIYGAGAFTMIAGTIVKITGKYCCLNISVRISVLVASLLLLLNLLSPPWYSFVFLGFSVAGLGIIWVTILNCGIELYYR